MISDAISHLVAARGKKCCALPWEGVHFAGGVWSPWISSAKTMIGCRTTGLLIQPLGERGVRSPSGRPTRGGSVANGIRRWPLAGHIPRLHGLPRTEIATPFAQGLLRLSGLQTMTTTHIIYRLRMRWHQPRGIFRGNRRLVSNLKGFTRFGFLHRREN